jgi:hypothetical protein
MPRAELVANNRSFSLDHRKDLRHHRRQDPGLVVGGAFILACFVASFTVAGLTYLVATGVGVWGHANPVNWAWDIVNFVFWIGIGHAGTLISAILCLLRQKWRTSINRAAEAMTIFAVVCAAIFPVFHVGRVWFAVVSVPVSRIPTASGRTSVRRWSGTCSRCPPTARCRCSSGMSASSPTWRTLRDRFTAAGNKIQGAPLRFLRDGLARLEPPLEQLRDGLPDPGRYLDPARALGAHDRVVRLRGLAPPGLAHDDLPAVFRGGGHLLRASAWCSPSCCRCAPSTASRISSRSITSTACARSRWRRAPSWATPTRWSSSSPGMARIRMKASRSSTAPSATMRGPIGS